MTKKEKLILIGKFLLTVICLLLNTLDAMCESLPPPAQYIIAMEAAAMKAMIAGSIIAFFVYWALWIFWDEKRLAKNRTLHQILFSFAAGLSLTRFLYDVCL